MAMNSEEEKKQVGLKTRWRNRATKTDGKTTWKERPIAGLALSDVLPEHITKHDHETLHANS